MTKKHYIIIAKAIKDSRYSLAYASVNMGETERSLEIVARTLSIALWNDNHKFSPERFLKACEIEP